MHLFTKRTIFGIVSAIILFLFIGFYITLTYFQGIPVLNYHQINNLDHNPLTLSDSEFEAQIKYLAEEGYTTITPEQLSDYLATGKELPPNPILITFDDGYKDNFQVAYPILQKYDFTATIFLISDFVGTYDRYLTWNQVKEMSANGFSFQSHTLSHIPLTQCSDTELQNQLAKSKEALEWHLSKKIEYIAYPCGSYDQRVIDAVKQAGYRGAFTINLGRDTSNSAAYYLNRIPIFGGSSHTFARFWLRLKFTQVFNSMQNLKIFLHQKGVTSLSELIYIP
ncbi:polysaccharide deacetylase family protein [Anaerosinus massiliensis]|uniref:polysaccharide deacetylase family protein n=1 Tax=Massilibacillus massiliensis TaxID=1806837 RepID=UPI000A4822F4|nr:polysaccharide deacetylase family protein [Massilibacillus massiliensis]